MKISAATPSDFDAIWPIFHAIVAAGETYAYPTDTSKKEAYRLWMELPRRTYVAKDADRILGTYYITSNYAGPGSHVCNCGYMVAPAARGQGVAAAMCRHSQEITVRIW